MKEDPIVAEIRRFREEHAEKYGYDLKRIVDALREFEATSGREVVDCIRTEIGALVDLGIGELP